MNRQGIRFLKLFLLVLVSVLCMYFTYMDNIPMQNRSYLPFCGVECQAQNSTEYAINTPTCIIPTFDPLSPSFKEHRVTKLKKIVCSTKLPLTEESGLSLLFFEERLFANGSFHLSVNCSYQGILRVEQDPHTYDVSCDRNWKLKEKIPINKKETPIEEDGIVVTCDDKKQKKKIYQNVHYYVQPRRAQLKRNKFKVAHGERGEKPEKLSVIIMGTDSVSRGNLLRHMPKTFDYLTNHLQAIDLKGFNKVADNTYPILIAMLTGISYEDIAKHKCLNGRKYSKHDDCPLIWKDFSEKGYVTAYGEDAPVMGAFHSYRAGFLKEPTDYFNRPYFLASEKLIGHNGDGTKTDKNYCQGERLSLSLIHKYSIDIAKNLKDVPYFGFYWTTSLTHNYLSNALKADQPSLDYLKKLHDGGYLDHTILFFLSDHGIRFGDFRTTYEGLLEERLPYVTIVFPKWFKERYPEAISNMMINTKRLTSTFDLYATLHDIVNQDYGNLKESSSPALKHGQSLFREVPANRTCEDAGIPEHYCTCEHAKPVDLNDTHLLKASKEVVKELNRGLRTFPDCSQLTLDKVLNGRVRSPESSTRPKDPKTLVVTYMVSFVTQPGGGKMEATVKYQAGKYQLASEVSRINVYGNQSHCITDYIYRKYCYCKDLLP